MKTWNRDRSCPLGCLFGLWRFFLIFFGRDLCLLHNKVVFTEFDPNLCTNDDTSLQLYNLTAPERQARNFYREFFKKKIFSGDGLSICFPCQCKSESQNVKLWPSLSFARGWIVPFDIRSECLGRGWGRKSLRESLEGEYPGLETLRLKSPRNPELCCRWTGEHQVSTQSHES